MEEKFSKIRDLIANSKTEEVLEKLEQIVNNPKNRTYASFEDELLLLSNRFSGNEKANNSGIINYDDYDREKKRIVGSILIFFNNLKKHYSELSKSQPLQSDNEKDNLQNLVQKVFENTHNELPSELFYYFVGIKYKIGDIPQETLGLCIGHCGDAKVYLTYVRKEPNIGQTRIEPKGWQIFHPKEKVERLSPAIKVNLMTDEIDEQFHVLYEKKDLKDIWTQSYKPLKSLVTGIALNNLVCGFHFGKEGGKWKLGFEKNNKDNYHLHRLYITFNEKGHILGFENPTDDEEVIDQGTLIDIEQQLIALRGLTDVYKRVEEGRFLEFEEHLLFESFKDYLETTKGFEWKKFPTNLPNQFQNFLKESLHLINYGLKDSKNDKLFFAILDVLKKHLKDKLDVESVRLSCSLIIYWWLLDLFEFERNKSSQTLKDNISINYPVATNDYNIPICEIPVLKIISGFLEALDDQDEIKARQHILLIFHSDKTSEIKDKKLSKTAIDVFKLA